MRCKYFYLNAKKKEWNLSSSSSWYRVQLLQAVGYYGEHINNWVGYADDIMLSFYDIENLQKGIDILNKHVQEISTEINVSKTKTMIFNAEHNNADYPNTICKLGETDIQNQSSNWISRMQVLRTREKTDELSYRPSNSRDNPDLSGTEPPNVCLSNVDTLH